MTEADIKQAAVAESRNFYDGLKEFPSNKYQLRAIREDGFIAGYEANSPKWIPVDSYLPQLIEKKAKPVLGLNGLHRIIVYYFPYHFKTVEWEDWDDYNQEDFPYTEEDNERGVVWLRPGFYQSIECDKCDGYWSSPLPISHWMPLPSPPNTQP